MMSIAGIFKFCLLIQIVNSFRTPKHNAYVYLKAQDNVFLTNPYAHETSYGIYVAGRIITVDIPSSVVNLSTIINWKVINLNKDQLMFVHNKRPQILIDQKIIKDMKFSGKLSGAIITLGDNEALHVPTIDNPDLAKPNDQWNYLELLHFDVNSQTVAIVRALKWLEDDWKFIKQWKMTDFIHVDDKLYLLIQRIFVNVANEISIVRLCLDAGNELFSSAIEGHYYQPEFQTNKITGATFLFVLDPLDPLARALPSERYSLVIQQQLPNQMLIYTRYFIKNFTEFFDQVAKECASGASNVTLFRNYLRSEAGACKKTVYKSCSPNANIIPSTRLTGSKVYGWNRVFMNNLVVLEEVPIINAFSAPYPFNRDYIYYHVKNITKSQKCILIRKNQEPICFRAVEKLTGDFHLHTYINHHPIGDLYVSESTDQYTFEALNLCSDFISCIQCIMYGLHHGCVWDDSYSDFGSRCIPDEQIKRAKTLAFNHCFKIIEISRLTFNAASPENLVIQLDRPLDLTKSYESLVITAGSYNHCTNITIVGPYINCSLNLFKSGKFKIKVSIVNDRYGDAITLTTLSRQTVVIDSPGIFHHNSSLILYALLLSSLLSSLMVITYYKFDNEKIKSYFLKNRSEKKHQTANLNETIAAFVKKASRIKSIIKSKVKSKPIIASNKKEIKSKIKSKLITAANKRARKNKSKTRSKIKNQIKTKIKRKLKNQNKPKNSIQ